MLYACVEPSSNNRVWTKERKVLSAIVVIAGAAFLTDRFLLDGSISGPLSAKADEMLKPVRDAATQTKGTADKVRKTVALADRLATVADQLQASSVTAGTLPASNAGNSAAAEAQLRDLFSFAGAGNEASSPVSDALSVSADGVPRSVADGSLKLTAVSEGTQTAMINGRAFKVGVPLTGRVPTELENVRLVRVSNESVVVEVNGKEQVLSLANRSVDPGVKVLRR